MKAAIIAGKVDGLREPGRWLADHPATTEIPDAWKPHLDGFREVTQAAASAEDIDAAAGSFVAVGNACAACHSAVGGPKFELGEPPGEQSGTAGHMARHQWAADRLWEGLITPSEELWIAGAEALADAPLHPTQLAENQTVPPEIEKLAKQVHEIGAKARDVKSSGIQGMYYGQLLATCAACHQQLDAKQ
jgi:hypothetical protein